MRLRWTDAPLDGLRALMAMTAVRDRAVVQRHLRRPWEPPFVHGQRWPVRLCVRRLEQNFTTVMIDAVSVKPSHGFVERPFSDRPAIE